MQTVRKIRIGLALLLIGVAPLHAFLITWLRAGPGDGTMVNIASGWRELFALLICVLIGVELLVEKRWPKIKTLDYLIIGLGVLALFWLPFQWGNKAQWMWGVRFDLLPLALLLFARQVEWPKKIVNMAIGAAAIVMIFGIVHALILPQDSLTYFGYSMNQTSYTPENAIASCQYLEHTSEVCRATSTFGGPTRYGTYLLLIIGLLFPLLINKTEKRKKIIAGILMGVAIFSVAITYSRSIWIGLFIMMIVAGLWWLPKKYRYLMAGLGVVIVISGSVLLATRLEDSNKWNISTFKSLFIRDISTNEHFAYMKQGVISVASHPMGIGLGKAGPASVRFGEKFLTENWYLQIAVEMGVIGALLWIGVLFMMMMELIKKPIEAHRMGLFIALIGISTAGLLTHSFEETSTMLILALVFPTISSRR